MTLQKALIAGLEGKEDEQIRRQCFESEQKKLVTIWEFPEIQRRIAQTNCGKANILIEVVGKLEASLAVLCELIRVDNSLSLVG
jgi:hypothetical protein